MNELFGSLGKLLGITGANGGPAGFADILGSDVFKNLLGGGLAVKGIMDTNEMMDFNKDLATKADARTQTLFQQDQEDRNALKSLDFG